MRIDADAHVIESELTWQYMQGADAQYRPFLVTSDEDPAKKFWVIDGRARALGGNVGADTPAESRELRDVGARLEHMDQLGVDVHVIYPSIFLSPLTARPDVERALCRGYNHWLAEVCREGKGRLQWVAVLPLLDLEHAREEARLATEEGACGFFLRPLVGERVLSDPYLFPLYEQAAEADLPICIHASTGSLVWQDIFRADSGFATFKLGVVSSFHALVYHRIPERFPSLRFGFIEVSAQWVPYALHDLAKRYQRRGEELSPQVMRDYRMYVACQTDDDLGYVLKYAGDDQIVVGSDYGHADTATHVQALLRLEEDPSVSPMALRKIEDDNARALYGLQGEA